MDKKPAHLRSVKEDTINQGLVSMLKDLLSKAESGKLRALIAIGSTSTEGILMSRAFEEQTNLYNMLGAMEQMKHRIIRDFMEVEDEYLY